MYKTGFDNDKYLHMQSQRIKERINEFGGKLYLEFGGKLFDDYHASRVLPGFQPDSKLQMLLQLKEQAEIIIVVSARDIEKSKIRSDIGITYDEDAFRLIKAFEDMGLMVGSVVLTKYLSSSKVTAFEERVKSIGKAVYRHYFIDGYPSDIAKIVSDDGYGKNDYIKTSRSLAVITAPGPGSGKMATCLSQLYHENKRGVKAGYAKFETFPVWNLPLNHPVNIAYEAATADLNDVNMIDPWHLDAYGKTTVNYNRDVEIFPVLKATFEKIFGSCPYKSPTDMGVNMAGFCIFDDEAVSFAARQEIIRRYYAAVCAAVKNPDSKNEVFKLELLMKNASISPTDRKCVVAANERERETNAPAAALEFKDGSIITGKTSELLGCVSALLLNALKHLAKIDKSQLLLSPEIIRPIQELKVSHLGNSNPQLHLDELLVALSICAVSDENAATALSELSSLKDCELHCTVMLSPVDIHVIKQLGIHLTCSCR